jgi:lysophospholipase L1-like esterase
MPAFAVLSAADVAPLTSRPVGNEVALYGDSRCNYSHIVTGSSTTLTGMGIAFWTQFLTRGRVQFPADLNFGVSGDTTTGTLARIAPVLACRAGTVILLVSTNDTAAGTPDLATRIANIQSMVTQLLAAGKIVIVVPELPRSASAFTGAKLQEHLAISNFYRSLAATRGVYVADPWLDFVQQGDASALPISGLLYDGLHPAPAGAHYIAKAIAPIINQLFPEPLYLLPSSTADVFSATNPRGMQNANPMMTAMAGTLGANATGQVATGWVLSTANATMSAVGSQVVSNGKTWQQITISGTPNAAGQDVYFRTALTPANFSPGDVIEMACEMEVDAGAANIQFPEFKLSVGNINAFAGFATGSGLCPNFAFSGVVRTPRMIVPATSTPAFLYVTFYTVSGATAALTARIGRVAVRKVI